MSDIYVDVRDDEAARREGERARKRIEGTQSEELMRRSAHESQEAALRQYEDAFMRATGSLWDIRARLMAEAREAKLSEPTTYVSVDQSYVDAKREDVAAYGEGVRSSSRATSIRTRPVTQTRDLEAGLKFGAAQAFSTAAGAVDVATLPIRPYNVPLGLAATADMVRALMDPRTREEALRPFIADPLGGLTYGAGGLLGGRLSGPVYGRVAGRLGLTERQYTFKATPAEEAVAKQWPKGIYPKGGYDKSLWGGEGMVPELLLERPQSTVYVPKVTYPDVTSFVTVSGVLGMGKGLRAGELTRSSVQAFTYQDPAYRHSLKGQQRMSPSQVLESRQPVAQVVNPLQDTPQRPAVEQRRRQSVVSVLAMPQAPVQEQRQVPLQAILSMPRGAQRTSTSSVLAAPQLKRRERKGRTSKSEDIFELRTDPLSTKRLKVV